MSDAKSVARYIFNNNYFITNKCLTQTTVGMIFLMSLYTRKRTTKTASIYNKVTTYDKSFYSEHQNTTG